MNSWRGRIFVSLPATVCSASQSELASRLSPDALGLGQVLGLVAIKCRHMPDADLAPTNRRQPVVETKQNGSQ